MRETGDTATCSLRLCSVLVFKIVCVIDVRPEITARFERNIVIFFFLFKLFTWDKQYYKLFLLYSYGCKSGDLHDYRTQRLSRCVTDTLTIIAEENERD